MRVLRARILAAQQEAIEAEQSAARRSQVKSVDRSERIRTYNFPENRIADHRTGYKSYNLDQVMDGALEPIVQSAIKMDEEARLAALRVSSEALTEALDVWQANALKHSRRAIHRRQMRNLAALPHFGHRSLRLFDSNHL